MNIQERNKEIEKNLNLVRKIANKYNSLSSIDYDDLFQEGCLGLIRAIEKFKPELGYTFATYASIWIRSFILKAIYNDKIIHLPLNIAQAIQRLEQLEKKLETTNNLNVKEFNRLYDLYDQNILRYKYHIRSLDAPYGYDGDIQNYIIIDDNEFDRLEEQIDLQGYLEQLNYEERKVLENHFGLNGVKKTLSEIGQELNLSHESVRQIEIEAIKKLRNYVKENGGEKKRTK